MAKKLSFFICGLIIILPVYAIRIDKVGSAMSISPGEQYEEKILLSNPTSSPIEVRAYLEDFEYFAPYNGKTKKFYPPGTIPGSLCQWVSFTPQIFVISPKGEQIVNFTITPDDSFTTARWAILFFETVNAARPQGKVGARLIARVGYLLVASPATGQQELEFDQIKAGPYSITGQLRDSGDTYIQVKGTYYIIDSQGIPLDRGELDKFYFFPGNQAPLEMAVSKDLSPNNYTAVITLDINNGEDVIVKEIEFSLKPSGDVEIIKIGEE